MKTSFLKIGSAALVLMALGCVTGRSEVLPKSGGLDKPGLTNNPAATNLAAAKDVATTNAEPVAKTEVDLSRLSLSPELIEIVKLAQSGVGEEVLLSFIAKTPQAYKLSADDIVYLNDLGVPPTVIAAMLRKEAKPDTMVAGTAETNVIQNPPAAAVPAPTVTPATNVAAATPYTMTPGSPPVLVANPPAESAPPPPPTSTPPTAAPQPPPTTVVNYNYFYDSLSPYGSWIQVPEYGYCWQPSVVVINRGWRPYCDGGRWAYTDCGWYWQSDYSWGWAPFHYGRWHRHHRHGWLWTPGYTWGPGWVSWRVGPEYCGWAPLPPAAHYHTGLGFYYHGRSVGIGFEFGLGDCDYAFISWRYFHHRTPHHYYAPAWQNRRMYEQSSVVNHYVTINGDNNTVVINRGIKTDPVYKATRQEVRAIAVREMPNSAHQLVQPDRVVNTGKDLVIYRPQPQTFTAVANKGQIEGRRPTGPLAPSAVNRTMVAPVVPPMSAAAVAPNNPKAVTVARVEKSPAVLTAPGKPLAPAGALNPTKPLQPMTTTPSLDVPHLTPTAPQPSVSPRTPIKPIISPTWSPAGPGVPSAPQKSVAKVETTVPASPIQTKPLLSPMVAPGTTRIVPSTPATPPVSTPNTYGAPRAPLAPLAPAAPSYGAPSPSPSYRQSYVAPSQPVPPTSSPKALERPAYRSPAPSAPVSSPPTYSAPAAPSPAPSIGARRVEGYRSEPAPRTYTPAAPPAYSAPAPRTYVAPAAPSAPTPAPRAYSAPAAPSYAPPPSSSGGRSSGASAPSSHYSSSPRSGGKGDRGR